jgi:hypothetical protein
MVASADIVGNFMAMSLVLSPVPPAATAAAAVASRPVAAVAGCVCVVAALGLLERALAATAATTLRRPGMVGSADLAPWAISPCAISPAATSVSYGRSGTRGGQVGPVGAARAPAGLVTNPGRGVRPRPQRGVLRPRPVTGGAQPFAGGIVAAFAPGGLRPLPRRAIALAAASLKALTGGAIAPAPRPVTRPGPLLRPFACRAVAARALRQLVARFAAALL